MIQVNEKYQITKDKYQWILNEVVIGKDKSGNPKTKFVPSYHASIEQIAANIINRELGKCSSMDEMIKLLNEAKSILVKKIEDKQ